MPDCLYRWWGGGTGSGVSPSGGEICYSIALWLRKCGSIHSRNVGSKLEQGSFFHEHARPLNKRFARRLTAGPVFIKMARRKAVSSRLFCSLVLANALVI